MQTFNQIVDKYSGQVLAAAPDRFGITQVINGNGVVLFDTRKLVLRDQEAEAWSEMEVLREQAGSVADVHIDDDLVGAAAVDAPPEKWRRLMGSSGEDAEK